MTNLITITKSGIIAFFMAMLLVFVFVTLTHAHSETNEAKGDNNNIEDGNVQEPAQKYGITFPIAELGNCANLAGCKQFCESPTNLPACIDFAKKKGFYRQPKSQTEIMALAKLELGCDSADSCRAFCGEQVNWLKCGEFAKKHNLGGKRDEGNQDSRKAALLQKAKTFLGCDSYDACKAFCQQPQNHSKCEELFRMVHQGENEHQGTPSGTPDRSFCQNLKEKMPGASDQQIKEYYIRYCSQGSNTTNGSAMEIKCRSYPGCSWKDERCQCSNLTPKPIASYSAYPKPSYDPAAKCQSYPGCSWNGERCQCEGTTSGSTPSSTVKGASKGPGILQTILHLLGF